MTLVDPSGKLPGDPGFSGTELVLQLAAGTTLAPDDYQLYIPNTGTNAIFDIFGNQLDGEFLGNLAPTGNNYVANTSFNGYTSSPVTATGNYQPPVYEDLIANDIVGGVSQNRHERPLGRRRGRGCVHERLHGRAQRQRHLCTARLRRESAQPGHLRQR